ncbi:MULTISPECIES: radical SAM family heme chaperone HemW [Spirulina sp. CCY15215]|uniref:radical SAM family heme chaperone HemW n=1 Tax=Spirulina sp. CCY15215 TaxID=2767591 RepID=UPI00195192D1|nr:radical SAM family heme chaperone HemW [Spirulina major]
MLETEILRTTKIVESDRDTPRSAYVHIPFCRRRCYYCDFPVSVVGDRRNGTNFSAITEYVDILCQEIAITPQSHETLKTIFFGGGTPSLLSVPQLEQILATLNQYYGIASDAEISMEVDPGTFNREQIQGYRDLGVNRFSLGVQAFQDELLQRCGRSHSVKDIFTAIDLLRQIGVNNLSLDLISGLPEQTLAQWQFSLNSACDLSPEHLSCYDLVLEPVTAFGKQFQPGESPLPSDENAAQMYRMAEKTLTENGLEHYEISNYGRSGYQCRHNRIYWENRPYYGFGMGAASYWQNWRFTRPRTRREYYTWVENGAKIDASELSARDILLETLMLGLRLADGVKLEQFSPEVRRQIAIAIAPYSQKDWLVVLDSQNQSLPLPNQSTFSNNKILKLTDPEGFLFSNTVLTALFKQFDVDN